MQCPNLKSRLAQLLCTVFIPPLSKDHTAGQASKKSERVLGFNSAALQKPFLKGFLHIPPCGFGFKLPRVKWSGTENSVHVTSASHQVKPKNSPTETNPEHSSSSPLHHRGFWQIISSGFPPADGPGVQTDLMQLLKTISVSLWALFYSCLLQCYWQLNKLLHFPLLESPDYLMGRNSHFKVFLLNETGKICSVIVKPPRLNARKGLGW